jgi:hypothetical protein
MAVADIQLTSAAIEDETPAVRPRRGVVVSEEPTNRDLPEELKDTALERRHVEMFLMEIKNQPHWRREADRAADYYDGNQLNDETVTTLQERGQPPLVTNLIKPTIDTVLGMEAKTRTDWRVRPEDDEVCDDDLAEALSIKLKHAEIESRADRAVSDAYGAQLKAGLGWVEVAKEHDPFRCPYRVKYIHRREIFWDWRAEQPDLSDARYLIRRRWVDLEHAIALMPQYADLFRMTTSGWANFDPLLEQDTRLVQSWEIERDTRLSAADWRDIQRERICLYEIWYRKWVRGYLMTLPNGRRIEPDFDNPRHAEAIVSGYATVRSATFQKVRLAWYTGPHFLYDVPSPYQHGMFPYVPFFGYREDLTNVPYGLVRSMISPQDEINARKSKMLWSLNSRRVIVDADAIVDHGKAAEEVARPDAYIILNPNRKPQSQFKVEPGSELVAQQFQVMQEAKLEIAESSGIHKSMQGQQSGATSGLAINSLVEQGLNTLAEINDNYRYSRRIVGEMLFDLVRQNLAQGPARVVIGQGKQRKVIPLNTPAVDEETGQQTILNDVSKVRAKVVLDDIPSTPTYRTQQFMMLTEVTKSLPPELQAQVIDFVVEATDLPKRHQIADRLRSAIGIQSPEQQEAAAQAQAQMQQEEMAMLRQERQVKMQETAAKAQKLMAEAQQIQGGLAAGGEAAEMQSMFEQQMRPLYEQITLLKTQLANREREIQTKYQSDIEKANIDAAAKIEAERAKAASMDALKPFADQIQALVGQIQQMSVEHKAAIDQLNTEHKAELQVLRSEVEMVRKTAEEKPEPAEKEEKEDPAMAQVLATLAQTQAALAKVMSTPKKTKIIEDKDGRAIGAVTQPSDEE